MLQQASQDGQDANGQQQGDGRFPEITWVGEQRLMHGYCGRAATPEPSTTAAPVRPANAATLDARPAAAAAARRARPSRAKVVRIGPAVTRAAAA